MGDSPDDIVGHKTIDTGERDKHGLPLYRHEPLTRAEGDALWASVQQAKAEREALMPDEQAALRIMHDAHTRLKELGWREAIYCPKDGSRFQVIEPGSTGIFDGWYHGKWPTGGWSVSDAHDVYPSRPILFKLYPEDQARYDAKMKAAAEKFRAELAAESK